MRFLFLVLSCAASFAASAQITNDEVIKRLSEERAMPKPPQSTTEAFGRYGFRNPVSPLPIQPAMPVIKVSTPGRHILPDGMPCLVPDMGASVRMPNAAVQLWDVVDPPVPIPNSAQKKWR